MHILHNRKHKTWQTGSCQLIILSLNTLFPTFMLHKKKLLKTVLILEPIGVASRQQAQCVSVVIFNVLELIRYRFGAEANPFTVEWVRKYFLELTHEWISWIRGRALIIEGFLGQCIKTFQEFSLAYPCKLECQWAIHLQHYFADLGYQAFGIVGRSSNMPGNLAVPRRRLRELIWRIYSHLRWAFGRVVLDHVREQDRTNHTVWKMKHCANLVSEAVSDSKKGVAERNTGDGSPTMNRIPRAGRPFDIALREVFEEQF